MLQDSPVCHQRQKTSLHEFTAVVSSDVRRLLRLHNTTVQKRVFKRKLLVLKSLLITRGQKQNRATRKMNLFTTWWNFEIMIHVTYVVKKVHFIAALRAPMRHGGFSII